MPAMGAPRDFDNPLLKGLRSWPVKGFSAIRIYYIESIDKLTIVRVLHGKRDLRAIFEETE